MEQIHINDRISIPINEIDFSYARSGGPGGQNVNKVETKAVLRFNLVGSRAIPYEDRARARQKLASRLTKYGVLVIQSDRHRDRERNRNDAIERLQELLRLAVHRPRRRVPTKPSRSQRERRLTNKKQNASKKRDRGRVSIGD